MTITVQPVTVRFFDQEGQPLSVRVSFQLTVQEIYNGIVVASVPDYVTTDPLTGIGVINLFPNALGANSSQYIVKAVDTSTGGEVLDTLCTVPDSPCYLDLILNQDPYPTIDAAVAAVAAAQGAAAQAVSSAAASASNATIAITQATNAAASAVTAAANTQAPLWVSGTTYALGDTAYSPLNYRIYRCKVAGTSTTDPSVDTTNWGAALLDIATDYPTIRPTLNIDWINQDTIDPRITVTRASTKTRVNAKGLIEIVPANSIAVDYDPVTLERKGVLIEESRTNVCLYSEDFSNVVWGKDSAGTGLAPVVSPNAGVAPDGTNTADLVVFNLNGGITSSDHSDLYCVINSVVGQPQIYSVWLRTSDGSTVAMRFDFGGASADIAPYNNSTLTVTPAWQRFVIGLSSPLDTTRHYYLRLRGTQGTSDYASVFVWGAQAERNVSTPSSYIPTTTAQVTRAADSLKIDGANFQSFYNQSEGSFVVDYTTGGNVVSKEILNVSDGTNANIIQIRYSSGSHAQFQSMVGSVSQASLAPLGYSSANTTYKRAISYKTDEFQQAVNGVIPTVADTSGSVPTVSRMDIGATYVATSVFNGYIRRLTYYNKALPEATLQALTQS